MVNFEYLVPTKMVFGKGTEEEAGRLRSEEHTSELQSH